MVCYQSVPSGGMEERGGGGKMLWLRGIDPQGKNADLKPFIITITRRHNDNNDNDNNPFTVVYPQSLVHDERTQRQYSKSRHSKHSED